MKKTKVQDFPEIGTQASYEDKGYRGGWEDIDIPVLYPIKKINSKFDSWSFILMVLGLAGVVYLLM